jgi:ACS family hexuronate transporter-like MFS transporter
VGAIIAPLSVPFIAETYGWREAFLITGAIGFIWLIFWFILYEVPARHAKLTKAEFDYIHSDVDDLAAASITTEPKVSWMSILGFRQTWAFVIGKFLTDPIWWFYLFWLPDFLNKQYGLSPTDVALPVALVYIMSSIGSVGGGYIPLRLIRGNWPVFRARKTSMLVYALFVVPIVFAQYLGQFGMWYAVLIIGLAAAAHQAWSANIFTTVSDMFPKRAVASVTGIGGMAGGVGGIFLTWAVQKNMFVHYEKMGKLPTAYFIMFLICGAAYLAAWLIMHILVPKMKPVELKS